MILVEKIIEQSSVPRAILCEDAQPGKLAVASEAVSAHDERAHDRLAHARQFRQGLPQTVGGHFQNLAFFRPTTNTRYRRCTHECRNISSKSPRADVPEDLLLAIARLKRLNFAAQDNDEANISLAGTVDHFARPQCAANSDWFEHGKLTIIKHRVSDALCVAIELLVFVEVGHRNITCERMRRFQSNRS
jgi:hypothetical protein